MKKHFTHSHERRTVLKLMMLGSGSLILPGLLSGCGSSRANEDETVPTTQNIFPQSVASGDPRANSVVLWTRIADSVGSREDLSVKLEVSKDEAFSNILLTKDLTAYAIYDHAIKVKIDALEPYTYYYYRFEYEGIYSNIGRTKTAPSARSDTEVKFAYISCQDYIGRYYNVLTHIVENDELDFIVHLGDYIYETNGIPLSQIVSENRQITFRDTEGTIRFDGYEAAASLDNYRQLYQIYRNDSQLQKLHEKFPIITIWDDHEFSNDNYGSNGNYYGDKIDEQDTSRFYNSQRAYLEYMPMETGLDEAGEMSLESEIVLDENNEVILYRDFNFGMNLDLLVSDYRSYRPDHLIKEDAFPATVFADMETIVDYFGSDFYDNPSHQKHFGAYFDVESYQDGAYLQPLRMVAKLMYQNEGVDSEQAQLMADQAIQGKLNLFYCNEMIKGYNATPFGILSPQILIYVDDNELEAFDKGLAYINGGKVDLFAAFGIGTRYMVVKDVYDIYIALQAQQTTINNLFGAEQEQWISQTLQDSQTTWRIFASSVSMTPMITDLASLDVEPMLQTEFYINLDQFDGFKYQRDDLIRKLKTKPSVVISGDIHSTFVTDYHDVVEFTGSSVTSATFEESLPKYVRSSDITDQIDINIEVIDNLNLGQLLLDTNQVITQNDPAFPKIHTIDMKSNGYIMMTVNADTIKSDIYLIDASLSTQMLYDVEDINSYFSQLSYILDQNSMELSQI